MAKKGTAISFSSESIEIANRWFNKDYSLNKDFQNLKLIENKTFFDTIERNPLNESQRKAVILDEKRSLVIAGAGTGKTSTLVAKLGYIINQRLALPNEILTLAFNNEAKEEINRRIRENILKEEDLEIEAKTFHGFGREVIQAVQKRPPITSRWSEKGMANEYLNFLKTQIDIILNDNTIKEDAIELLTWELTPYPIEKELLFNSMGEYRNFISNFDLIALNGNVVKSYGELLIANYLFIQGIPFTYEDRYKSNTKYRPSFEYYPDFHLDETNIYIEYFGTDRLGKTAPYIDAEKYNREIENKKKCHKNFETTLIDLYYFNLQDKELLLKLEKRLTALGVKPTPRSESEIIEAFKEHNYTTRLLELFKRFRILYKSGHHNFDQLENRSRDNYRTSVLLKIFKKLYTSYENELDSYGAIDFTDMINMSTDYIKSGEYKSNFKYILIDEYQDLSPQRYRLIEALLQKNPHARLYCVGDDWQSIYGFTGSDVKYTKDFNRYYNSLSTIHLNETFRFSQPLCDLAAHIISKNNNQIKKNVVAKRNSDAKACFIHRYEFNSFNTLQELVKDISSKKKDNEKSLLILGRNKKDLPKENQRKAIKNLWGNEKVSFKTCHAAKGLEFDYLILHKLQSQFPAEKEDDPIIKLVLEENSSTKIEEERRLLYVSITRAKEEVHITTDVKATSSFVFDLLEKENNTELIEHINAPPKICGMCESAAIYQLEYYSKNSKRKYIYSCTACDYESFACPKCRRGQALLINEDNTSFYECERECGFKQKVCEICNKGYLRNLKKYNAMACTGYRDYGCRNYKKIK